MKEQDTRYKKIEKPTWMQDTNAILSDKKIKKKYL